MSTEAETRPVGSVSKLSKNQRNELAKRIKQIESEIPTLEAAAAQLSVDMASPKIAADFARLNTLAAEHKALETRIQDLYDEWDNASEQLR